LSILLRRLYRAGKIILIKRDLNPVAIDYQSSLSFELSDACQIEETKYILVINYISHTEYLKLEEIESPKLSNSIFNKLDILKSFLALVLV
jgi:hypothetical protein